MSLLEIQSVSVVFGGLVAVKKVNLTIRKERSWASSAPMERAKPLFSIV